MIALLLIALICFIIAGCGVNTGRLNLIGWGLAFWVLYLLVGGGAIKLPR